MVRWMRGVVVLALVIACGNRDDVVEPEHKKITTKTEYDASKGFVDEDYRFEVKSPGPGWVVMRESDARHLNVDAIAAVRHDTVQAVAIVEALPGATLGEYTDLIVANMAIEDKRDEREETTVSGIPAMRVTVRGKFKDLRLIYRAVLFVHQDHGYQFLAFTPGHDGPTAELDRALGAFSIVPGRVKGRRTSVVIEDQVGVGWWIDGGIFESAATRLRAKPPKGWRLMVGDELQRNNSDAEIGFAGTDHNIYMTIIAEPIAGSDEKAYIDGRLADAFQKMTRIDGEPPVKAKVLGRDLALTRARSNEAPMEFLIGIVVDDRRAYQFTGWYPAPQRKTVEPLVLAAMESVEILSKAAREKLATKLAVERDRQNEIGATFALRDGTFHDFTHHVRWKKPPGFWSILVGQAVRANNSDALLRATDVVSGVVTQLIVEPSQKWTTASYHPIIEKGLVDDGFAPQRRGPASIAGRPALMTEGKLPSAGLTLRYRVTTAVVDSIAIQVSTWAAEGVWPDEGRLAEITAAVDVAPDVPETQVVDGVYVDNRFGYSVALSSPWRRQDITPRELRAIASAQQWSNAGAEVVALALFTLEQRDDAWLLDLLEQMLRQQLVKLTSRKPKVTTSKLDGRTARHLTWNSGREQLDVLLLKRDATFYVVGTLTSSSKADATLEFASRGFRLR